MPSRKLSYPSSHERDRKPEERAQSSFTGTYEDQPATKLPQGTLHKSINAHQMGDHEEPRNGSLLWTFNWPNLDGRTGYAAHKSGNVIISDSGNIFEPEDVQNLWVWDNGYLDEMVSYISPTQMRCSDTDVNTGTNCSMRGKLNVFEWHKERGVCIIQRGQELYTGTPNFDGRRVNFTKVIIFSRDLPSNAIQDFAEDEQFAFVNGSGGMYRINLNEDPPKAYRLNTPIMNRRPLSTITGEKHSKYRYIVSVGRFENGNNFGDRLTTGVQILTESGTNTIDGNNRDWAEVNTGDPIHNGLENYGVLDGGPLPAGSRAIAFWNAIVDGVFQVNINNLGWQNVIVDYSTAQNLRDVATLTQDGIRLFYPSATVEYRADGGVPRFRVTTGRIAGSTIVPVRVGTGGTNIAGDLALRAADGATISNPPTGRPNVLYDLYLPIVPNSDPLEYQWHWNRYCVYRTGNIGPAAMSDNQKKATIEYSRLNETGKKVTYSQDEYIHCKDLRVCGSFLARMTANGYIDIRFGEMEEADVGSVVEFENGTRVTITGFVNSKLVTYDSSTYCGTGSNWMAACIGNGRVARVRQDGDIVTRLAGTLFYEGDERKPITWPEGTQSYIREHLGANRVRVWDTVNREETGVTLDPQWRNFNDILDDDSLYARASGWTCRNRFMVDLPLTNLLSFQPGFLLCAATGRKEVHYCQLESTYRPFLGYYVDAYQKIIIEDKIVALWGFPMRFSALCQSSIFTGVTNTSAFYTIPGTQQIITILPGMDKRADVGLSYKGSIAKIDDDWIQFVTNSKEVRRFNGEVISRNLAVDEQGLKMFDRALQNSVPKYTSISTKNNGYVLWFPERA